MGQSYLDQILLQWTDPPLKLKVLLAPSGGRTSWNFLTNTKALHPAILTEGIQYSFGPTFGWIKPWRTAFHTSSPLPKNQSAQSGSFSVNRWIGLSAPFLCLNQLPDNWKKFSVYCKTETRIKPWMTPGTTPGPLQSIATKRHTNFWLALHQLHPCLNSYVTQVTWEITNSSFGSFWETS
jgi:hypothetical protein